MLHSTAASPDTHGTIPVDETAFAAFSMREVDTKAFDTAIVTAGDALVCVFFWGVDCFNCEMAEKAVLAQSGAVRKLGLKWLHTNIYVHPELGQRSVLHGISVFMFFHRDKKLGWAAGWHDHTQLAATVANAHNKLAGKPPV